MNVLSLSRLFPNRARPTYGVFVANRIERLARRRKDDFRVIAPVGRKPFARDDGTPETCKLGASTVEHPRFCVIPKIGFPLAAHFLYRSVERHIAGLLKTGYRFDLIDAHFYYPDGVAAVWLAERFDRPVVVTARGSDLNIQADLPVVGRMIRRALAKTDWTIAVSQALGRRATELGAPAERVTVLRNGVDLALFRPLPRQATRERLGITGKTLLSVGNLVPLKGHDLVIRALQELGGAQLLIIGTGPQRAALEALVLRLGLAERVRFLGAVPYERMPEYFSAADMLILASRNEGWPNVLLEAMACGTPVVATPVGGIPEIISCREAGLMLEARSAAGIAAAVRALYEDPPAREAVRRHAERYGWDEVIDRQLELFDRIVSARRVAA